MATPAVSTDQPEFGQHHGEAARRYLDRCRQAGDTRSPLHLLTDLVGRERALRLLPHAYEATIRAENVLPFPQRTVEL